MGLSQRMRPSYSLLEGQKVETYNSKQVLNTFCESLGFARHVTYIMLLNLTKLCENYINIHLYY